MHATVPLEWHHTAGGTWILDHLGMWVAIVRILKTLPNTVTLTLGDDVYRIEFWGDFDQEWRDQLQAIVEEDITCS